MAEAIMVKQRKRDNIVEVVQPAAVQAVKPKVRAHLITSRNTNNIRYIAVECSAVVRVHASVDRTPKKRRPSGICPSYDSYYYYI
jgi:hypothetical protein